MRGLLAILMLTTLLAASAARAESFSEFLRAFEVKAVAGGVSREVYRAATTGLTPDPSVPKLVETQPEFTTPIWEYLDARVTDARISKGKAKIDANRALFASVGQKMGVDPYILGAIWGVETDYGAVLGNAKLIKPIIRSSTLR